MGVELKYTVGGCKLLHERFLCSSGGFSVHDRCFSPASAGVGWLACAEAAQGPQTVTTTSVACSVAQSQVSLPGVGHDSPPTPHHMTNSRDQHYEHM